MFRRSTALLICLSVVSGCDDSSVDPTSTSVLVDGAVSTSMTPITLAETTTLPHTTTSSPAASTTTLVVSDVDVSMVAALVNFAKHDDDETFAQLPLAVSVMLGLGSEIMNSSVLSDLRSQEAWSLELEAFRAHVGPFSALDLLDRLDEYQIDVGPHVHCAAAPEPPPTGLEDHRRVSVQPTDESRDSCLQWFTVDLFVGTTGLIEAVTLDLWEP